MPGRYAGRRPEMLPWQCLLNPSADATHTHTPDRELPSSRQLLWIKLVVNYLRPVLAAGRRGGFLFPTRGYPCWCAC